ncbi:MAG: PAS domain S-box protein [Planctomycetota bacterium]|nr:PAS domain S-box protein [Planctomycetota bacterium]
MTAVANGERRSWYPLVLIFGVLAAAFGFVTLLGWILGLPRLGSFGADLMPMAPSTAVLLLLYGIAICVRARTPLSRRVLRISVAAGWLGAMLSLLLFTLGCLGIQGEVEHLGWNTATRVGGVPIGHMSPVTAFCFLLASVSFLASLSRSATQPWRTALAPASAGVLLGTCSIILLIYLCGTPLVYGGEFIPPALNTILALVMLSVALLALAHWPAGLFRRLPGGGYRPAFAFILILVVASAGIVVAGYIYYRNQEKHFCAEVEGQLSAIAELKLGELVQWRQDRMADAAIFFKNPSFSALVRRFFEKPADADVQRQLLDWLGKYSEIEDYDQVRLMDVQDVTRLSAPAELNPASPDTVEIASEVLRSGQITIQDFYRHKHNQRIYLAVLVPILDEQEANRPLGMLVLRIDPTTYLYPFIQRWPTPSRTAETLLVRRDGNDAIVLSEAKFQTDAALKLRISLEKSQFPIVKAALGQHGFMEGEDYCGCPTVAAVRAVPDSPWSLEVRMDAAEVYAPLWKQLWQVIVLIGTLLLGVGACVGLVWRQQRVRFLQERFEASELLRQAEAKYRLIFDNMADGVFQTTPAGRFQLANPAMAHILGFASSEELIRERFDLGRQGYSRPERREEFERLMEAQSEVVGFEYEVFRKDGRLVWVSETARAIRDVGSGIVCYEGLLKDITERKQAEDSLRKSEERHRTILQTAMDGFCIADMQGCLLEVNDAYSRMTGYSEQELLTMRITDLDATEFPADTAARIQKIRTQGEDRFESRHRRKDGSIFDVEISVQYGSADGGWFVTFLQDITERKRAEVALRESETLLMESQRIASLGSYIVNIPTGLWKSSVVLDKLFGIDEAYDRSVEGWAALLHPDDRTGMVDYFRNEVLGQGQIFDKEYRIIRHDDQAERWVHGLGKIEFDAQGRPLTMHGTIQDITGRKRAEDALRESLCEKVSLLKEIHHRVKNNLQIISSLLRLQSDQIENAVAKGVLQDMQNRVRSMALIHDHLYRSENLAAVDLAAYLQQLCQQLFQALVATSGTIQLQLDLAPVRLDIDQAIPCGLLVNELVSNALKHAFPDGRTGQVRVELQSVEGGPGWLLRVVDDGVGLPAGFDLNHSTSLGLQLVFGLTRQIGGQLEIGTGPGAMFAVVFGSE